MIFHYNLQDEVNLDDLNDDNYTTFPSTTVVFVGMAKLGKYTPWN